jgi:multidrug efflux pump subunit AcrB
VFISFGVLLFLFRNLKVAFTAVYFSSGYCWQLFIIVLTNTPLNVGSYTGLIMIVGIISENAILPIYNLKKPFLVRIIKAILVYAISTRLRPKLMTALGAIIALLPLAIGIGTGSELHQPLAYREVFNSGLFTLRYFQFDIEQKNSLLIPDGSLFYICRSTLTVF